MRKMMIMLFCFSILMKHRWNEIDKEKLKYSEKNPTWTDPGSNPVLRGERPATNRLSHGLFSGYMGFYV
jgi:hypothetical protein